jgi:hypothetical protein
MSRDRFKDIISVLHLSTNALQPERDSPDYDRLYKVRGLLTNLNRHFEENAEKETIISVDEQMIPYKRTLGLKVYMKGKPTKWGLKVGRSFIFVQFFRRFYRGLCFGKYPPPKNKTTKKENMKEKKKHER